MKRKNKFRGFTLVETIVSLAVLAIMISMASGVIITTFNVFGRNTLYRAAQNEGNNVYNYIYDHISCATALKIGKNTDINYKGDSLTGFYDILDEGTFELQSNSESVIKKDSVKQYYEVLEFANISSCADTGKVIQLQRKTVNNSVDIFGNSAEKTTPYNFECVVLFSNYTDNSGVVKCTVKIKRDGEIYFEKEGSIPLLNCGKTPSDDDRIIINNNNGTNSSDGYYSNENSTVKVLYTYVQ